MVWWIKLPKKDKNCEWCNKVTSNPRFCCRSCFFKWGTDAGIIGFKKGHTINSNGKNAMFRPDVREKQRINNKKPDVIARRVETQRKTYDDNFEKYGKRNPKISDIVKKQIANGRIMPNGMIGKKITEEHKMKLWNGRKTHHTRPELMVLNSYYGLIYTGDGSKWLKFEDGTYKNPDIVFGNYSIAIEVFGNYWHDGEDINKLIHKYNNIGWECLVLWEKDIYSHDKNGLLGYEIDKFINSDIYEPCISPHDLKYGINESLYSEELKRGFI